MTHITSARRTTSIHGFGPVCGMRTNASRPIRIRCGLRSAIVAFALTRDVFYTAIALGIVLTLGPPSSSRCVSASTPWSLVVCLVAMMSSKASIDFSTSGLENPLTHLLLLVFVWRCRRSPKAPPPVADDDPAALCL